MRPSTFYLVLVMLLTSSLAVARDEVTCGATDATCLSGLIASNIPTIENARWRDYAYRDLAISIAYQDNIDGAVSFIDKIENPDTRAMTIRAIGMALALHKKLPDAEYKSVFAKLDGAAATIKDEGARDIAYTYIAMSQAFAGLDEDATKTTDAMTKPELKHKAFGETAEIQAERGDYDAAMKSVNAIDSTAFKNKALGLVSDIFVKREEYQNAFNAATQITNATKKTEALQKILDAQIGLESYRK